MILLDTTLNLVIVYYVCVLSGDASVSSPYLVLYVARRCDCVYQSFGALYQILIISLISAILLIRKSKDKSERHQISAYQVK